MRISDDVRDGIRDHVKSIHCIESHYYCCNNTTRKYFESEMSISRLYENFVKKGDFCQECEGAIKYLCSHIFLTEFHISFQHRKKDRCDKYELFQRKRNESTLSDCEQAQ